MSDEVTQTTDAPVGDAAPTEVSASTQQVSAAPVEEKKEVPAEFKSLIENIEKMTVLELHSLVKALESHFGVSAAAVAVAGPAAGGAGAGEEKSEFTVELTDAGAQKIQVIKAVKEALGLGLAEAKALVDGVPTVLKENMKKDDANALKAKVEEAGGKVTLK
jgi:large subunit ribosomal protein L7/L12